MEGTMAGAIERISRDLGLPRGDAYTQDWAYELPEEFRSFEFFPRYVKAYSTPDYQDAEKLLLMQLMLDIVNDLLGSDEKVGQQAWNSLTELLRTNPGLHHEQVEYWALPGEPLEDAFHLTPLIRDLQEQLYRL
jgi:hypothetical protein